MVDQLDLLAFRGVDLQGVSGANGAGLAEHLVLTVFRFASSLYFRSVKAKAPRIFSTAFGLPRISCKGMGQEEFRGHLGEEMLPILIPLVSVVASTFSQLFKEKCISEVVRIGSINIFRLSKL